MSWGFSNSDRLTSILAGTAIVAASIISYKSGAIAKTSQEVAQIAQNSTVQINNSAGDPGGTGVIIAKQSNIYTVLTANHVVRSTDTQYTIRTHTNKEYAVTKVQRLQSTNDSPDLAVVTFSTAENYAVATLGNSDRAAIGADIYVCGYPLPSLGAATEREFLFTKGIVSSRPQNRPQGYTLRYDAITRKGMSGGPVFDILGRVVGIHGQADIDDSVAGDSGETIAIKTGINSGIPINIFVAMKSQTGASLAVDNAPTGDNPTARLSNPQNAKDYYARGISRYDEKDYQGAIKNFNQALRIDPNFAEAYSKRGAAKFWLIGDTMLEFYLVKNRGIIQEAIEDLNQALQLNPNDAYAYLYRAIFHYTQNRKQQAIDDINQSISLDSNESLPYVIRGSLNSGSNNQRAFVDYNQAILLDPNNIYAYSERSILYYELAEYQKALDDINQAIRINPNRSSLYVNRGHIRSAQKDFQGAIEDLNQALRLNPNSSVAYVIRAEIRVEQKDFQGAEEDINQIFKLDPNSHIPYFIRGLIRYKQKNYRQAIEDFTAAIRLQSNYAQAYFERGDARDELGEYDLAIQDYTEAIRLQPNFAQAYWYRGVTHAKQGNRQGALADLQTAARLYQQQGNTELYQKVEEMLRKLQQ